MLHIALFLVNSFRSGFFILKRVLIVTIVFTAVISLFLFFRKDEKLRINNVNENSQSNIKHTLADLQKDTSQEGQVKATFYKLSMCSFAGIVCDTEKANLSGGYLGAYTNLLTMPFKNPPASSIAWVQQGLEKTGLVPTTYAATGLGFTSISAYMDIWKVFRDISYLLLVIFLIAIGFMIMFRVNIGGQTVINIENSLPRIVMTMLLITFSFPIAGFLIDMMYALITLLVGLLYNVGDIPSYASSASNWNGKATAGQALYEYTNAGFTELWPDGGGSFFSLGTAFWNLVPSTIQTIVQSAIVAPLAVFFAKTLTYLPGVLGDFFSGFGILGFNFGNLPKAPVVILIIVVLTTLLIIGPGLILGTLIVLTILMLMFRLFFLLLQSYIKVLLYIIFSPIILLFSAFPGNGNVGWWLRNLIGELIAFPTLVAISLVGNAIMSVGEKDSIPGVPSQYFGMMLRNQDNQLVLPFLHGFDANDFNSIIALGLVLMIPDFIKMLKEWIGVKESPLKMGIGTFFASAGAITGGGMKGVTQYGSLAMTMPGLNRMLLSSPLGRIKGVSALFGRPEGDLPRQKGPEVIVGEKEES